MGLKQLLVRYGWRRPALECQRCGATLEDRSTACPGCDRDEPVVYFECRRCGTAVGEDATECPVCERASIAEYEFR